MTRFDVTLTDTLVFNKEEEEDEEEDTDVGKTPGTDCLCSTLLALALGGLPSGMAGILGMIKNGLSSPSNNGNSKSTFSGNFVFLFLFTTDEEELELFLEFFKVFVGGSIKLEVEEKIGTFSSFLFDSFSLEVDDISVFSSIFNAISFLLRDAFLDGLLAASVLVFSDVTLSFLLLISFTLSLSSSCKSV